MGMCFLRPMTLMQTGFTMIGCDCDGANDHGYSQLEYGAMFATFVVPLTFGGLMTYVLLLTSCCVECSQWRPYWSSQRGDRTETTATAPTESQANPLAAVGAADQSEGKDPHWAFTVNPWGGGKRCLCALWGVPPPAPTLSALRQQHAQRQQDMVPGTAAGTEIAAVTVAVVPAFEDPWQFIPPTIAGGQAWARGLLNAHKEKTLDRKWASAGRDLLCSCCKFHPTAAAICLFLLSLWFAHGENNVWQLVFIWALGRAFGPCVALFCLRPNGCCKCNRLCEKADGVKPCSFSCFTSACGYFALSLPLLFWLMILQWDCTAACTLTMTGFATNAMDAPMKTLFSKEYYGRASSRMLADAMYIRCLTRGCCLFDRLLCSLPRLPGASNQPVVRHHRSCRSTCRTGHGGPRRPDGRPRILESH
jgi:hypothetical protein